MNVIHCFKTIFQFRRLLCVSCRACSCRYAQTVLIDFGSDTSFRGLSVHGPDSNGNFWNSLQPGVLVSNLVDIHKHSHDDSGGLGHASGNR